VKPRAIGFCLIALLAAQPTAAVPVDVVVTGTVEYNQLHEGPFRNTIAPAGSPAMFWFTVDSDIFSDDPMLPTRGYVIDQGSFNFQLGPTSVGLQGPFPGTPYFVIRNNDPAVDGFFLSPQTNLPFGLELTAAANDAGTRFLRLSFSVTYGPAVLPSLALGTYDYTGLTVFRFVCEDLLFEPIGIIFEQLTITSGVVSVEKPTWGALKSLYR